MLVLGKGREKLQSNKKKIEQKFVHTFVADLLNKKISFVCLFNAFVCLFLVFHARFFLKISFH